MPRSTNHVASARSHALWLEKGVYLAPHPSIRYVYLMRSNFVFHLVGEDVPLGQLRYNKPEEPLDGRNDS
jgi:hypothetical protein